MPHRVAALHAQHTDSRHPLLPAVSRCLVKVSVLFLAAVVAIFRIQITETQLISARISARRPTKEVDAEQGFGVMSRFPHCALVRSYVLNNLENGPASVADLVRRGQAEFGFSQSEIEAAAKHFAVVTRVKKGKIYWMRPANLIAIWWGLGRDPSPFRRTAAQR